eukprot:3939058-Rhodomonas_salina.2
MVPPGTSPAGLSLLQLSLHPSLPPRSLSLSPLSSRPRTRPLARAVGQSGELRYLPTRAYAMSGTEIAYAALSYRPTRALCDVRY